MWLPVAVWQVRLRTAGYTLYCMLYFNLLYITSHAAMGCTPMTLHAASRASVVLHLHLNRCVAKVVASRPVIGWRLHAPSNSTQIADGCAIGQLLCFRRMQAITANTVIAYITHDDRPNIHQRQAGTERSDVAAGRLCITRQNMRHNKSKNLSVKRRRNVVECWNCDFVQWNGGTELETRWTVYTCESKKNKTRKCCP